MENWQKYAAEVYGTFVLVGVGIGAILATGGDTVAVSFAFGLALVAGLYTVGRVSGGHFNPAVSLGAFLDQRISLVDMIAYWVSQLLGAVLAGLVFAYMLSTDFVAETVTRFSDPPVDAARAIVGEAMLTLIFVMAVLVLAKSTSYTKYLGMGLTLVAVHLVGIAFTGASVNPARSLGPAIVGSEYTDIFVYIIGPVIGAILAWVLYKVVVEGDTDLSDDVRDMM